MLKTSPFTVRFFCFIQSFDFYLFGYICSMNSIETLYAAFLKSTGISTDTRTLVKGNIFFALKGPAFNGNHLVNEALEKGALLAVADDENLQNTSNVFYAENSLQTLQQLATFHRMKMKATVIGITGSNGKTTTKELISKVLSKKYSLIYTQGNLNNHIGVPLTLLTIKPETEMAVIEMGANHIGEIRQLCRIARPEFGIITNIGKAHIEGFGGFTGVINAKTEMYSWIDDHGKMLFVNTDNELLDRLSAPIKRFTFGSSLQNDVYGELVANDPFLHLAWEYKDHQSVVATKMIGSYNNENILAAIAIGCYFGVDGTAIDKAIGGYVSSNNRSQLMETEHNRVVMDAYNANPTSMAAAIHNLDKMRNRKAWLIIGDMLELGADADAEHADILKLIIDLEFKNVILVGPHFKNVIAEDDWLWFEKVDELVEYLGEHPIRNADILVKASRGIQLEKVLPCL